MSQISTTPRPARLCEIIKGVNLEHPDWGGGDIADFVDCTPGYVYAVARNYGLKLPAQKREGGRLRRTERSAALMDLGFLRKAIEEDDPLQSLLARIDDLEQRLRKQEV